MGLVLYGNTAFEFWRSGQLYLSPGCEISPVSQIPSCTFDARNLSHHLKRLDGVPSKIEVLDFSRANRRRAYGIKCHYFAHPELLPKGSFCHVNDEIYVASPELCFAQLAHELSFLDLVRAGFDLCSRYLVAPHDNMKLIECNPATNKQSLEQFINRVPLFRGRGAAVSAVRWVLDNSRSPRETSCGMLMNLPTRRGGFQFPNLELNVKVNLKDEAIQITRKSILEADAACQDFCEYFEYESWQHHSHDLQFMFDYEKIGALQAMQYRVTPITSWQLSNFDSIDAIFRSVKHRMGLRDRTTDRISQARRQTHYEIVEAERNLRNAPVLENRRCWQYLLPRL